MTRKKKRAKKSAKTNIGRMTPVDSRAGHMSAIIAIPRSEIPRKPVFDMPRLNAAKIANPH
jgi:hypothetical protein